ncbi:MAG: hypothetical protein LBS46_00425 [Dysgonamonadaceae bacterium]|jgi:hypothetical protein|nr:hypothetical protein [Dysgonamonadaceae bacterium]
MLQISIILHSVRNASIGRNGHFSYTLHSVRNASNWQLRYKDTLLLTHALSVNKYRANATYGRDPATPGMNQINQIIE